MPSLSRSRSTPAPFVLTLAVLTGLAACSGGESAPDDEGSSSGAGGTSGKGGTGGTGGTGGSTGGKGGSSGGTGGSTGGAGGTGGATGGTGGSTGGTGGTGGTGNSPLGSGVMTAMGRSSEQYATANVTRDGVPYTLITNGWGPGFGSHTVSYYGTSFIVETMSGSPGGGGEPASYPSVFCGKYSVQQVPACGLPATIASLTSLRTGWRWAANGNAGAYNAAYDIWIGNGTQLQGYLMVWLRDPPGFQPAGSPSGANQGITVANVPGTWNLWSGTVNNLPIRNYVRAEGSDLSELEFDVMDFVRDTGTRGLSLPGTHVNSVAVGFEIWQGPITNLESVDFYVDVN